MNPSLIAAAVGAVVTFWFGAAIGYRYADAQGEARVASLQAQHAEDFARATAEAAARLTDANAAGEALMARANAAEAARKQSAKERDDAIRKTTVGRPCLGAAAVGVLNAGALAGAAGAGLPAAAGGAADGAFATDTDVAAWIGGAIDGYETCRGWLDVVVTWREQQIERNLHGQTAR